MTLSLTAAVFLMADAQEFSENAQTLRSADGNGAIASKSCKRKS